MAIVSPLAAESWVRRYTRNGKPYGNYFGFYRFPGEAPAERRRVNLETRDGRAAKRRLRGIIEEEHDVREGLKPSAKRLEVANRPLTEYVTEYVGELNGRALSRDYVRKIGERLPKLCQACGWARAVDISAESFERWRASHDAAPKTKNDFLAAAQTFGDWLVGRGAVEGNPLRKVRKARVAGRQRRPRRPLTLEEARRLLTATPCPKRRMLYLLALSSGGRLGELTGLLWGDVEVDRERPWITFRADKSKNGREQRVPLPQHVASELAAFRPVSAGDTDRVFKRGIGRHSFDADLMRAGIEKRDPVGRAVSFHCLRMTYNQLLQEAGVPLRHAQHLLRHGDPRLTANTYLDPERLTVEDSVALLPPLVSDTVGSTPDGDAKGRGVASCDASGGTPEGSQVAEKKEACGQLSSSDATRPQASKSGAGGIRTPVPKQSASRVYTCSRLFNLGSMSGKRRPLISP